MLLLSCATKNNAQGIKPQVGQLIAASDHGTERDYRLLVWVDVCRPWLRWCDCGCDCMTVRFGRIC